MSKYSKGIKQEDVEPFIVYVRVCARDKAHANNLVGWMFDTMSFEDKCIFHPNVLNLPLTDVECVKCGSTNLEVVASSFENGVLERLFFCNDCGAFSTASYALIKLEELEDVI